MELSESQAQEAMLRIVTRDRMGEKASLRPSEAADEGFMLMFIKQWCKAYIYADEKLQKKMDFAFKAVCADPRSLEYISDQTKNKDIVLEAIIGDPEMKKFAGEHGIDHEVQMMEILSKCYAEDVAQLEPLLKKFPQEAKTFLAVNGCLKRFVISKINSAATFAQLRQIVSRSTRLVNRVKQLEGSAMNFSDALDDLRDLLEEEFNML